MLASEEVTQNRRAQHSQLIRALDEGGDDLVSGAQSPEDVVLKAVDVVVRRRGSNLPPTSSAFCDRVDGLFPSPAHVEEGQARLLLRLRGSAAKADLLGSNALGDHAGRADIELVPPPVVPGGMVPPDLYPSVVVIRVELLDVPLLAHLSRGPTIGEAYAGVQQSPGSMLCHEVAVGILRVTVEDVNRLTNHQRAHRDRRQRIAVGSCALAPHALTVGEPSAGSARHLARSAVGSWGARGKMS
mmetsp:Transcript_66307/g.141889  ORF Transcript_66307/g.141889 Transcript_66307/m.141889 type:complete len:243 (-) Transcript_66307:18-746(-)